MRPGGQVTSLRARHTRNCAGFTHRNKHTHTKTHSNAPTMKKGTTRRMRATEKSTPRSRNMFRRRLRIEKQIIVLCAMYETKIILICSTGFGAIWGGVRDVSSSLCVRALVSVCLYRYVALRCVAVCVCFCVCVVV